MKSSSDNVEITRLMPALEFSAHLAAKELSTINHAYDIMNNVNASHPFVVFHIFHIFHIFHTFHIFHIFHIFYVFRVFHFFTLFMVFNKKLRK